MQPERRVRPRNRRALIADAAGRAFSERGYHAVAMDDIAADVGITAAALYRHFPGKYALFVHCAIRLADSLVETLDDVPRDAGLPVMLHAVARTTVAQCAAGGIYRWEARYLQPADRDRLRSRLAAVLDRVAATVHDERRAAGLAVGADRVRLVTSGALGAIASVTAQRTSMSSRRLEDLVVEAAERVALFDSADPDPTRRRRWDRAPAGPSASPRPSPPHPPDGTARTRRREEILAAAVPLFYRDGYASVSMGTIAAEVGLAPSALYRHYESKADILFAACLEAAERLRLAVDGATRPTHGPAARLAAVSAAYVEYAFAETALTAVAAAELGGLPPAMQRPLVAAQRAHLAEWTEPLLAARPGLAPGDARVLVHAALGVVNETGRSVRWEDPARNGPLIVALALRAVGVLPDEG